MDRDVIIVIMLLIGVVLYMSGKLAFDFSFFDRVIAVAKVPFANSQITVGMMGAAFILFAALVSASSDKKSSR